MDETAALGHLEALAHGLGIDIRYEVMEGETAFSSGGLCRLKGKQVIIMNKRAEKREKIQTLARALRRFELGHIYVRPAVRDLLESVGE